MPAGTATDAPWLLVLNAGERIFLLDGTALIHDCALSVMSQRQVETARAHDLDSDRSNSHVVFRAGVAWAAPMTQTLAVTAFPASFHRSQQACPYFLGTFEWRGQALALLDLRLAQGHTATQLDASARIIVIQVEGALAGRVVEEVTALIPAHVDVQARFSMGRDTPVHMLTVGQGESQKSQTVMDFTTLAFFKAEAGSPTNR